MISGRADVVPVGGEGMLPGVGLTLALTLPTGRGPVASRDGLGADITGQGRWELRPGVMLERTWGGTFVTMLGASVALRPPERDVELMPRWQLTAAAGPTLGRRLAILVGATAEFESAPRIAGSAGANADRARTSLLAVCALEIDEHWSVVGSVQAEPPLARFGRNDDVTGAVMVGVRRVWLEYD